MQRPSSSAASRMPIAQAFAARSRSSAAIASCTNSSIDLARGRLRADGSLALVAGLVQRPRTRYRRLDDVVGPNIGASIAATSGSRPADRAVSNASCSATNRVGTSSFVSSPTASSASAYLFDSSTVAFGPGVGINLRISFSLAATASAAGIGCRGRPVRGLRRLRLGFRRAGVVDLGQRRLAVAGKRRQVAGERHAQHFGREGLPCVSFPSSHQAPSFTESFTCCVGDWNLPWISVRATKAVFDVQERGGRPSAARRFRRGAAWSDRRSCRVGHRTAQPRMAHPADSTLSNQLPPSR